MAFLDIIPCPGSPANCNSLQLHSQQLCQYPQCSHLCLQNTDTVEYCMVSFQRPLTYSANMMLLDEQLYAYFCVSKLNLLFRINMNTWWPQVTPRPGSKISLNDALLHDPLHWSTTASFGAKCCSPYEEKSESNDELDLILWVPSNSWFHYSSSPVPLHPVFRAT